MRPFKLLVLTICVCAVLITTTVSAETRRLLYVATPGIRDSADYGGTGILVFDIDRQHQFVRRIDVPALGDADHPKAAKGICASADTGRLYVSTPADLTCLDLRRDAVLWRKAYEGGCDRMSISPDGRTIYEPMFEGDSWHVIDALSGEELKRVKTRAGSHNTVFGPDGKHVYLAGLRSPMLAVANAADGTVASQVGPFGDAIRPFTVNGASTRAYVCVNGLLGFEVGDLVTGKKIARVEVSGFQSGPTLRHGCPSHGVALTPGEKEVWVCDAHNSRVHVFDNTTDPPRQLTSVALRDQPGWITFGPDGRFAYPSTGDVIDAATHKVVGALTDEHGKAVASEKLLEIDFNGKEPTQAGDQFGVGRVKP